MSDQRYSADLIVTEQDFAECGWQISLADGERESYSSMWQAFSSAARNESEDNRPSHGKTLWLLADALGLTCLTNWLPASWTMIHSVNSRDLRVVDGVEADLQHVLECCAESRKRQGDGGK